MTMPARPEPTSLRHLLGLQGMLASELRRRLAMAWKLQAMVERNPTALLELARGRVVANIFFEDSTRTRTSFAIAARRIGAEVVELVGSASSVNKGETLIDTARNVAAMGVDAIVTRTRQSGGAMNIAGALDAFGHRCAVVNGGDGRHEHPTQGLLDTLTLAEAAGRIPAFDLSGLTVAIVGDVVSSRVARSNIAALTTLGAQVLCVGPAHMAPRSIEGLAPGVRVLHDMDEAVGLADAVMMLRIQFERHADGPGGASDAQKKSAPIASVREFRAGFALTAERAARMKPGAVVMHPGPINRNIELDADVADGPRSVVMRQVTLGVAVRMATLAESSGGHTEALA
jgi:aspartate carbamoyltransferase catalytic subunit